MTDTTDVGVLNGQLATASPKLTHLTAQRPKVKGRRLPKRQGSLTSSGGLDQSGQGCVAALITDSPKLSHPTAERPRIRGRRPPKRYASPEPVENHRPEKPLPPTSTMSLEDHLTEYQNTIQLITSDTSAQNKCLTLRGSIKTMISSSITCLTNKAGKKEEENGTSFEQSEFEQLASELESQLRQFEELLEREKGSLEEVEGQQGREELEKELDEVRTQMRDLGELRTVQRTLHDPQETSPEMQQNEDESANTSGAHDTTTATTISDPLMHDSNPPGASDDDDDIPLISKEIRIPLAPPPEDEGMEDGRRSTEVVSLSVHSRIAGFDTGRGPGEYGEEMEIDQHSESTPLLGDSTKRDSFNGGGKLCECCVLL